MDELRIPIEYRADESRQSPGRIVGVLMEYETRAGDRPEMFSEGALTWPDGGVILNEQHDRTSPILRFTPKIEGRAVLIDEPLPDTQRGRDAATMISNGTMTGLSVEFRSRKEDAINGVRMIRAAVLAGAALVDDPSYPSSTVEVREKATTRLRIWL